MTVSLGFMALGFLVLLLAGKTLAALETRALERQYRTNQHRIIDLDADLETSRRKYLISLKAEGVSKHKMSQLKIRYASHETAYGTDRFDGDSEGGTAKKRDGAGAGEGGDGDPGRTLGARHPL